jgi:hypothetical protein
MEILNILILGVLGDILGFKIRIKNRMKITKKNYGESYIEEGKSIVLTDFYSFLLEGGVNQNISNLKYSINTLMLMATMKGIKNNEKDFKQGCLDEYIRIYKKKGDKNLKNIYIINNEYLNSLEKLSKNESIKSNIIYNDSMVIPRILPIGLLLWKKEDRRKLIVEIINNISLTHKNITTYLTAITLGLFISYKKYNINIDVWGEKIIEYFLSNEFDTIIKELKLYSTEFVLDKEDYITTWKEYLNSGLYKNRFDLVYKSNNLISYKRANTLFLLFNEYNSDEFVYGLKAEQSLIIAYDSLLSCEGSWEKMIILGIIGITDNSVQGMICGILFGLVYNTNDSINKEQYRNEPWIKKVISLGKELDFN